jgi:photosystem II stability/assembly factor-like uncharacterized protein
VWAATPQGAFRSTDGGDTWELRDTGIAQPLIPQIVGEPAPSKRVYAATQGGVFVASADVPKVWTPASNGLGNLNITSLALDATASPHVLYATTDNGLFASGDQGANWSEVPGPRKYQGYSFVTVDSKTTGLLYLIGYANNFTGKGAQSWVSHDAGGTWDSLPFNNDGADGTEGIVTDPDQAGVVYIWSVSKMLKSVNGGQNFDRFPLPLNEFGSVAPITIMPSHGSYPERIIDIGCGKRICFSADGGRIWIGTGRSPNGSDLAILAADPNGSKIFMGTITPNAPVPMEESANVGVSFRTIERKLPQSNIGPWIASKYLFAISSQHGEVYSRPLD